MVLSRTASAVVSPAGKIHAVRPSARATACGLDYNKRSRRSRKVFLGWVVTQSPFSAFSDRGQQVCFNCIENLDAGTGPQGESA